MNIDEEEIRYRFSEFFVKSQQKVSLSSGEIEDLLRLISIVENSPTPNLSIDEFRAQQALDAIGGCKNLPSSNLKQQAAQIKSMLLNKKNSSLVGQFKKLFSK